MNFDTQLFTVINGQARRFKALDAIVIALAEYLPYLMIVALAVMAYRRQQWYILIIPIVVGLFARFFPVEVIYAFYQRKRPLEVLPIQALLKKPSHPSFPSGHASFFFAVALATFLFNVPMAIAFVVLACLMGLARIFCGVHWPSDILAGFLVAAFCVFLLNIFL